jgi:hypothetical protein
MSTGQESTGGGVQRQRKQSAGGRKLSPDDVEAILARLQHGETHEVIAMDYPVSRVMVSLIASGKKWAVITRKLQITLPQGGFMVFSWTYDPRRVTEEERQAGQQLINMLRQYSRERRASLETRE